METQTAGGDVEKEIVVYNGNTSADKWTFKKNLKPKPKIFDGKRKRGRPRKKVPVVDESSVFIENVELENDEYNQQTNMSEKENNQNNIDLDTECSKEGRRHHSVKEQTLRVSKHGRVIKPKRFSDDMVSFIKDEAESDMEVDAEYNFTSSADLVEDGETKAKYDSLDYTVFKVENDEPVRKYACEQCEFSTSKMKEFIDHHREHLHAEKKCSYCGWVCDNPDITEEEFREHLNNHKGSNPYFCTFCSQRFDTRAKLYQHLPKHSKNRPYVCNICHAAFKWKQALKTHMIIHKGSKDYLCDICGFSTAHKPQLKAHHLIHTGNTFKCEEPGCDYQTTKRGNLKFHLMTHSREKPHQCELCGQAFSLVKNMKRHMLLHTTDRPFSCEKCSFNTTRLDKLKEHYFKQHQIGDKPKKKLRLTEYMKMQAMLEEIEQSHDQIETNVLNIGEGMETIELQVAEDTNGLTTTQIVNVTSSTGESIPIAITQNDGEVSYEIQQIPVQIVTQEIFTE